MLIVTSDKVLIGRYSEVAHTKQFIATLRILHFVASSDFID